MSTREYAAGVQHAGSAVGDGRSLSMLPLIPLSLGTSFITVQHAATRCNMLRHDATCRTAPQYNMLRPCANFASQVVSGVKRFFLSPPSVHAALHLYPNLHPKRRRSLPLLRTATSAPGLGSPWAATSAPGLGSPWAATSALAHPCHICAGTARAAAYKRGDAY